MCGQRVCGCSAFARQLCRNDRVQVFVGTAQAGRGIVSLTGGETHVQGGTLLGAAAQFSEPDPVFVGKRARG